MGASSMFWEVFVVEVYRALNPVAEISELKTKGGIADRVEKLDTKRIGLFSNNKPMAKPILMVLGERLAEKYPQASFSHYEMPYLDAALKAEEIEKAKQWASEETDVVIGASGD